MIQQSLFGDDNGKQERFQAFHKKFPEVYRLFREYAWSLRKTGRRRYSVRTIIERIRWQYAVNPDREPDGFKINDHHIPRYARKLIEDEPSFDGFFELRAMGD